MDLWSGIFFFFRDVKSNSAGGGEETGETGFKRVKFSPVQRRISLQDVHADMLLNETVQ